MSAFLGPIHYWLYNKISLQQAIVDKLYTLGKEYSLTLEDDCNNLYGTFANKPLEEMIDHGNIHGWLQDRVSQVEYKYAYSVTKLIAKSPEALKEIKNILFEAGKEIGSSIDNKTASMADIYKLITDNLLDGMPCDHANSVIEQKDQEIIWKRNICVHKNYWDEVSGDINIYYALRDAWLEGFVAASSLTYNRLDPITYSISKGE